MALRVFLSYSLDPLEMALAWRLQTLAVAHGIEMFVPPRTAVGLGTDTQRAIDRSDCVLAIIAAAPNDWVQQELSYASTKGKLIIPIVRNDLPNPAWLSNLPRFAYSPWDNPGTVETKIVEFLKKQQLTKEKQQAVGALAALGLGLLVLFALNKD